MTEIKKHQDLMRQLNAPGGYPGRNPDALISYSTFPLMQIYKMSQKVTQFFFICFGLFLLTSIKDNSEYQFIFLGIRIIAIIILLDIQQRKTKEKQ